MSNPPAVALSPVALSPAAFRHLIEDEAGSLIRAGISAVFGSTVGGRKGQQGTTWISLTSPWGYGRMIRHGDGSTTRTANDPTADRPLPMDDNAVATPADFRDLMAAVGRPGG